MVPRQPCLSICKGKGSVRGGKFRQGGPVTLTARTGASAQVHPRAQARIEVCSCASLNGGWHAHCSQGSVLRARPLRVSTCQAMPSQVSLHNTPGKVFGLQWAPVLCHQRAVKDVKAAGFAAPPPFSWGQNPVSALFLWDSGLVSPLVLLSRGHSLLRQLCACFTTSFRGMWILAGLGKPSCSGPLWTVQGPGTLMRCFQTRGLPGMLGTRSV